MCSIIQTEPPIRLHTPEGKGYSLFFTDSGAEADQVWTVALDDGRIIAFPNWAVRAGDNLTLGRRASREPEEQK